MSVRRQGRSLALLTGLRIWRCRKLWRRSKMWLRPSVAVAVGVARAGWNPSPGTSMCRKYSHWEKQKLFCIFSINEGRRRNEVYVFFIIVDFFFLLLFRAAPAAYGDSQARGRIRATAASLHHSHSNSGSELRLQPTPQLTAMPILNPLSEAGDWTCDLMIPSQVHFWSAVTGTPKVDFLAMGDLYCSVSFCCAAKSTSPHTVFLILSFVMFHHECLGLVSCAVQQECVSIFICPCLCREDWSSCRGSVVNESD